jgi:hypothetical protein
MRYWEPLEPRANSGTFGVPETSYPGTRGNEFQFRDIPGNPGHVATLNESDLKTENDYMVFSVFKKTIAMSLTGWRHSMPNIQEDRSN